MKQSPGKPAAADAAGQLFQTAAVLGTFTHCDNFERDALSRWWRLIHVLVPLK
jgi:TPR repeat protein